MFDSESILRQREQRGEEAKRLLDNPLLIEAFASVERDIMTELARLDTDNDKRQDALCRDLRALRRIKTKFDGYVSTGEAAKRTLLDVLKGVIKL